MMNFLKKKAGAVALVSSILLGGTGLGGCALSQVQTDQITQTLTALSNKAIADLTTARAKALAATPADTDGAACFGTPPTNPSDATTGTGAITVAYALQQVVQAGSGQPVGAITAAEFASIIQPGSAQFNWAVKTLETACIAKVHDVNQAINSTAGIFVALPSILGLVLAPAGA